MVELLAKFEILPNKTFLCSELVLFMVKFCTFREIEKTNLL